MFGAEKRFFHPRNPSPSDFELRSPFCGRRGVVGDGSNGEEGGPPLLLPSIASTVWVSNASTTSLVIVCKSNGGLNVLFLLSSLPANACSLLAVLLSTYGRACTGLGLNPRTWCCAGAHNGWGLARLPSCFNLCADALRSGRCGGGTREVDTAGDSMASRMASATVTVCSKGHSVWQWTLVSCICSSPCG